MSAGDDDQHVADPGVPADVPPGHPAGVTNSNVPLVQRRYRLVVAYDGSAFYGWQRQVHDGVEWRTVQQAVEDAVNRVVKPADRRISVLGASRTDTGVHARGQVATFDATTRIPLHRFGRALVTRLPDDVDIRRVDVVPDTFSVFTQVTTKQYRYRVFNSNARPLGLRHLVYPCWHRLDLGLMRDAAARIVGTHDFACFSSAGSVRATTVRTVHACDVEHHDLPGGPEVHLVLRGDGFLYNMVRIIAGTLVDIGRHHIPPDSVQRMFDTGDRRHGGRTLSPGGLSLEWIRYADGFCSE